MTKQMTKKMEILLFRAGRFFWGIDVTYVVHVLWGISSQALISLKENSQPAYFGIYPGVGLSFEGETIPAIPLLSSTDSFEPENFGGVAVVIQNNFIKIAILADEVIGAETLKIPEQIYSPPVHLKRVFSGRNIWAVAEIQGKLIYLIEPDFEKQPSEKGKKVTEKT